MKGVFVCSRVCEGTRDRDRERNIDAGMENICKGCQKLK